MKDYPARMMQDWLVSIVVLAVLLLVLIPSRYQSQFVINAYHQHPWTAATIIIVLVLAFGWWVRNQTELKLKNPR